MGVADDWTTGIALTASPDNENEYVLLNQEITAGDSVKVVTLTDGVATAWCGNVDKTSTVEYINAEDNGNIVLVPGKYNFYFKVKEDLIYIEKVGTTTGVDNTTVSEQPVKIVRNGQVLILKGNKMFNIIGQQVK
jgi:hypothetical protein